MKNQYSLGDYLNRWRGTWTVCGFKESLARESRKCFWGTEFDVPMHTMLYVYVYFLNIFFLVFINKNVFFSFSFLFCDEIINIRNRILTNQKPESVIRNCQWNCMCNSSVIKIRWASLPPCQLPKVGLPIQMQLMGFGTQPNYKAPGNLLIELVELL